MAVKALDPLKAMAQGQIGPVPDDAVPFHGVTGSLITGTTAVEIQAAPGAGKAIYVTKLVIVNRTAAETPVITIQDDTGTPIEFAEFGMQAVGDAYGTRVIEFNPALEITANKALDGVATSATGDCQIHAYGFTGTASASL